MGLIDDIEAEEDTRWLRVIAASARVASIDPIVKPPGGCTGHISPRCTTKTRSTLRVLDEVDEARRQDNARRAAFAQR